MIFLIFILLAVFEIKHFVADWLLQNMWMVDGKRMPWTPISGWTVPLSAHAGIHGGFTAIIIFGISILFPEVSGLLWLAFMDFGTHFLMDRIKGAPNLLGQFGTESKMFWISMGIDQLVHHLMNLFAVYKVAQRLL